MNKFKHTSLISLLTLSFLLSACSLPFKSTTKVSDQPVPLIESTPNTSPQDQQLVGGDRDTHGCIGSAGYTWCAAKQKCLRTWEEECQPRPVTPEDQSPEDIPAAIKAALATKNGWDASKLDLKVNQVIDDQYVSATVNFIGATAGGGYVFAAKVGDNWEIVADGNGVITCDQLQAYSDFPTSLIGECFNVSTGQVVNR